jgi:hypothetical protein
VILDPDDVLVDLARVLVGLTTFERHALAEVLRESLVEERVPPSVVNLRRQVVFMMGRADETEADTDIVDDPELAAMSLAMGSDDVAYAATRLSDMERFAFIRALSRGDFSDTMTAIHALVFMT